MQASISKYFRPSSSSKVNENKGATSIAIQDSSSKKRVREEISLIDDDDNDVIEPIASKVRTESSLKDRFKTILTQSESTLKTRLSFQQTILHNEYKPWSYEEMEEEEEADDSEVKDGERVEVSIKKTNFTPLELQVVTIRKQFPDCLLMVECGYRMRFFGDDALKAAKALGIYAHKDHNFMVASIPTYRCTYHCQRLLSAGLKVAIVRQTETAALRKGTSSSNKTFDRKVAGIFTQGTLIDSDDPAFDGLVASFQKKSSEGSGEEDDNEDEDDNAGTASNDPNISSQDSSLDAEDSWIAAIHCKEDVISIAATNILAHKLWICDLHSDSIFQGLMDYLDILKVIIFSLYSQFLLNKLTCLFHSQLS